VRDRNGTNTVERDVVAFFINAKLIIAAVNKVSNKLDIII